MTTTCDTPEDPQETRLSLKGLQAALAEKLQNGRPDHKTLYRWLARPLPMPSKPMAPMEASAVCHTAVVLLPVVMQM